MNVVTKTVGLNRFVWDVTHSNGLTVAPGEYQVRVTIDGQVSRVRLNVLIDPRLAEEGLTPADLQEQFDHTIRVRELNARANQLVGRVRQALAKFKEAGDAARLEAVNEIAGQLLTEPVRYGKPGLQAHISYLGGLGTRVDQKVGRDALQRYEVLKKEFDTMEASFNRIMGG
jgi:hypothetical protein